MGLLTFFQLLFHHTVQWTYSERNNEGLRQFTCYPHAFSLVCMTSEAVIITDIAQRGISHPPQHIHAQYKQTPLQFPSKMWPTCSVRLCFDVTIMTTLWNCCSVIMADSYQHTVLCKHANQPQTTLAYQLPWIIQTAAVYQNQLLQWLSVCNAKMRQKNQQPQSSIF